MDADTIRFILLLAGLALILGIFVWDRQKKAGLRLPFMRKRQAARSVKSESKTVSQDRREPVWEESVSNLDEADTLDTEFERLDEILQEEAPAAKARQKKVEQSAFSFFDYEAIPDDPIDEPVPEKILQINVVGRNRRITGDQIMQAARDVGLLEGDMQVFHFSDDQDRMLFSMANMVNPGTFPPKEMNSFVTPGVTLFSSLPGPAESMAIFEQMLNSAQRLAALFDAELQDDSHSDLTKQTIDHIREEIIEYERRLKLARLSRKTASR